MSNRLISSEMLIFKEAIRHIWNTHFSILDDQILISDGFFRYEAIEKSLFWAIVAVPLGIPVDVDEYRKHPLKYIELKIKNSYNECPMKIGKQAENGNITWNETILIPSVSSHNFLFFDFFDWNPYDFVDQNYIRFWIKELPLDDSSEGRWGLIETQYIDFYYSSTQ